MRRYYNKLKLSKWPLGNTHTLTLKICVYQYTGKYNVVEMCMSCIHQSVHIITWGRKNVLLTRLSIDFRVQIWFKGRATVVKGLRRWGHLFISSKLKGLNWQKKVKKKRWLRLRLGCVAMVMVRINLKLQLCKSIHFKNHNLIRLYYFVLLITEILFLHSSATIGFIPSYLRILILIFFRKLLKQTNLFRFSFTL